MRVKANVLRGEVGTGPLAPRSEGTRWALWLPLVAAVMAVVTIGLASLAVRALTERNALVLEGRVLTLVHEAERSLRDLGPEVSEEVLSNLLQDNNETVAWMKLEDNEGTVLAVVGRADKETRTRRMDLFLGRVGVGSSGPPGPTTQGFRRGRGRFVLELGVDQRAAALPLVVRAILPAAVIVGLSLLGLAFLGGNLLERQRILDVQAAQRRRLEALGRAGAGLAHQLRNPLATIKGSCQLVAESLTGDRGAERLEVAVSEARRMERMLGLLLDYARPPTPEATRFPLNRLIEEIRSPYGDLVVFHPAAESFGEPFADPEHVGEILRNLLDNAMAISPDGEVVEVVVGCDAASCSVAVLDRGPGPGESPEELFEPYFTTRVDGAGLGLAIARNLAQANGGDVVLTRRERGGCRASLTLPLGAPRP